eukprot:jgi/Psemu1/10448/gm1.10448_g
MMFKRKATWSTITNLSDRDVVISLLRSAGHGIVLDRNVDLVLSSKVKIDINGNVVELTLGTKNRSSFRSRQQQLQQQQQQQQQQQRNRRRLRSLPNNGNGTTSENDNDDDLGSFWDLSEAVGKLEKLNRLVLHRCRSIPSALNELPDLTCLELHFCHGNQMARRQHEQQQQQQQQQQRLRAQCAIPDSFETTHAPDWSIDRLDKDKGFCRLPRLTILEINDGELPLPLPLGLARKIALHQEKRRQQREQHQARRDVVEPFRNHGGIGVGKNINGDNKRSYSEKEQSSMGDVTSCLKRLSWTHSGLNDRGLDRLLRGLVLPFHPSLVGIDVSGNQIRSLQWLLDSYDEDVVSNDDDRGSTRKIKDGEDETNQCKNSSTDKYQICMAQLQQPTRCGSPRYHSLRTLNLQHNPILKRRTGVPREQEAFEALLMRYFPVLGSLTPSWENWDAPIEHLLRINRGGRVFVEGIPMPPSTSVACRDGPTNRNNDAQPDSFQTNLPLGMWPLVLHRAYETSPKGFLPPRKDATALYYLVRNGPALYELFAAAK